MDEVKDKTIRTRMPILLGIGNAFKRSYSCEQFLSQGIRDKLVGPPDALCWANLEMDAVSVRLSYPWELKRTSIPVSGSRRAAYP
jgi:hypothetical protein